MMRHIAANALTLLVVGLAVLFGLVSWAQSVYRHAGPLKEPLRFEVAQGETMSAVADRLDSEGAIESAPMFRVAARYTEQDRGLRYGEYEFPAGASMAEILRQLNRGGNIVRQIVVPEGWTSWQVVEMLKGREELAGEISGIPPEGSLAPAGYDFQKGDSRQELIERMQERQEVILAEAWATRVPDLPLDSPEELLTLASIVEKETGVPEERDVVASVFENRLRRGMRLQTDPTVIYGITRGEAVLGRGLRRSELAAPTDYNTYAIIGLPPTPIANPGRDAIMATAQPAETEFLYFVADGTGGHVFARTLTEHNANVAKWRRIEAERARAAEEAAPQDATSN
jgi:UPF0755 protein